MQHNTYDVIIIGGGFAGLTATIWLRRYNRTVLVISGGPSRNCRSHAVHGYPGFEGENPAALLDKLAQEAGGYEAEMLPAWADHIEKKDDSFIVKVSGKQYAAPRVLLASGTIDVKPQVPGFEEIEGISGWHCPACDGYEYTGKKLAIISWGPHMVGYVCNFFAYTTAITVYTDGHEPGATIGELEELEARGIHIVTDKLTELINNDGQVNEVRYGEGGSAACDGVFYSIEHRPRTELVEQLDCHIREDHSIAVNRKQETSIEGLYAAGDVAPLEQLVVVAAATGAIAASNIHKSLALPN